MLQGERGLSTCGKGRVGSLLGVQQPRCVWCNAQRHPALLPAPKIKPRYASAPCMPRCFVAPAHAGSRNAAGLGTGGKLPGSSGLNGLPFFRFRRPQG